MSRRFSSLSYVPAETRSRLRDRLSRYLPSMGRQFPIGRSGTTTLHDELFLKLLLNIDISFDNEEAAARSIYSGARQRNLAEPAFDDLIAAHSVRVIWGRIAIPAAGALPKKDEVPTAWQELCRRRFDEHYRIAEDARNHPQLAQVITSMERGKLPLTAIGCRSPGWIVARLWERMPTDAGDQASRFRRWVDCWQELGWPPLNPFAAWDDENALGFVDSAFAMLESKSGLFTWEEVRESVIGRVSRLSGQPRERCSAGVPKVPKTLIDRLLWLESPQIEDRHRSIFDICERVSGVAGLLLNGIEAVPNAQAPHPFAKRLLAIAVERPELLLALRFRLRLSPKLLADVLLYPPTSALACFLVAEWQPPGGAWDRELAQRDDETTKLIAFSDAVSIMGWFLERGSLPPAEAAALLKWLHRKAKPGFVDDDGRNEPILQAMRGELVALPTEILQSVTESLMATPFDGGVGAPEFAAAIDLVDMGKLVDHVDPAQFVVAYVRSISAGSYGLTVNRISLGGAVALVELAIKTPELRSQFLGPIDIKAELQRRKEENPYTVEDTLCRSLRAHMRILSRALTKWPDASPPQDLVDALISSVKAGALRHTEKGRIPAFAPRHEMNAFRVFPDRPIAADLGAALVALDKDKAEQLLAAIFETDEPMVLAQLTGYAPYPFRERITKRLNEIQPSEAGDIWSLPEAQMRIEALLSAGAIDAANLFIEAEAKLQTFGKVPGRTAAHLRSELRLRLLRGDWAGIRNVQVPDEIPQVETPATADMVAFYKGLAALNDSHGDRTGAEQVFSQLQQRRPDIAAYSVNLFAARIGLLLRDNLFGELRGDDLASGRRLLAEAEDMMRHARGATADDNAIFASNKAILLLALGKPQDAIELLAPLTNAHLNDAIAAYRAVALARIGQTAEALAGLERAEQELGSSEVLKAARAQIQEGRGFNAAANASVDEDPVPAIQDALLSFSHMDPVAQAEAWCGARNTFFSFVSDHVRFAAASVVALVPMMKSLSFERREDDLNSLIGQLLGSRLHYLNWSVGDQSLGGYTAALNPGERDLVIKRDSAELAVIEAVICESSIGYDNLKKHFQKLFAYGNCRLFFHLTYAYLDDRMTELHEALERIAANEAPEPFKYKDIRPFPSLDSRPKGFVAKYGVRDDEAQVVFLVLDLSQGPQKEAAAALKKK